MIFTLNASLRNTPKSSDLTKLRAEGCIPAVIYGPGIESIPVTLKKSEFMACYKKSFNEVSFYEIELDGKKYHTLLKEKQPHPVTREFLHLDFMIIPVESLIEIEVPVKFVGDPAGLKEGGMVDIIHRMVKISCKANAIPEDIELNVSNLKVGESMHVRDLPAGDWHIKENMDNTLIVVHPKKKEEAAAAEKPEAAPEA
ncbi:MAG TPA: 50S ribosomal protein L25 [Candidatus Cloacimonadota bacterium]|nr:50S ribosomal protein L25 [Candidatus Cloacimonadota bacterium]HPS38674.1 50S ribosomal protein L25 [Candidatus Cloacimonadota bacterium]